MYFDRWRHREPKPFYEKGWQREGLAEWDAKWHALSAQARLTYVAEIKTGQAGRPWKASVAQTTFPPQVLKELADAGFVEIRREGQGGRRVFAADAVLDFVNRVRHLKRFHLLAENQPSELGRYLDHCFFRKPLLGVIHGILGASNITDYCELPEAMQRYLTNHRWPQWVLAKLQSPLTQRLLTVIEEADQPIPVAELPSRLPDSTPPEVRTVLDDLITRLALFEDLDPTNGDLLVGLLPVVRQSLIRSRQPRQRPPLQKCEAPHEVGPDMGPLVNDLRSFLLELAGEPPRLRQDHSLYQKEMDRFLKAWESLPAWLLQTLGWSDDGRLNQTLRWARHFKLVEDISEHGQLRLHLSAKGHQWLAARVESQHADLYRRLRDKPAATDEYSYYYSRDDFLFLASRVRVVPLQEGAPVATWMVTPEQRQALRDAFFRVLADLPISEYYRLDSFLAHATFEQDNPLLLGRSPHQVTIWFSGPPIPALPERLEEVGRLTLDALIRQRLIALGAVRAGIDAAGHLCIARLPRLEEYFGQESSHPELVEAAGGEPRVIVQPDFSVIIIGLNPTPAAELAPFCERITGHAGQGSLVLKITRESVVKAIIHGMDATEIVGRLQRHASTEVPANVLHELREWGAWVRRVHPEMVTVLRCPDRETADRTVSALGKVGERLNETVVALRQAHLTGAERKKLQKLGIIVQ